MNLKQRIQEKSAFEDFVGQSLRMKRLYESIRTIALTDYTILIRGESGTGKELAARAIHSLSKRRNRPMIIVNCPAIPEHLLESELFGHKKGAFTGANRDHLGLFEEAHNSTILLDEIGDIPVSIQTKLLRVLQEQEIKPLGSRNTIKVDVRIIATTNQNLEQKIQDHTFREDLFYRLNVVTLTTPPLRQIKEDIPLLVNHFARRTCSELGITYKRFTVKALKALMSRIWPGNVRELENFVKRVVMFCPDDIIRLEDIEAMDDSNDKSATFSNTRKPGSIAIEPYKKAKDRVINRFTLKYVSDLLEKTGGNVTRAAELSGLGRTSLQKIMKRLGIKPDQYRASS